MNDVFHTFRSKCQVISVTFQSPYGKVMNNTILQVQSKIKRFETKQHTYPYNYDEFNYFKVTLMIIQSTFIYKS